MKRKGEKKFMEVFEILWISLSLPYSLTHRYVRNNRKVLLSMIFIFYYCNSMLKHGE